MLRSRATSEQFEKTPRRNGVLLASKPRGVRLTPTSRYIRDKLFPKRG